MKTDKDIDTASREPLCASLNVADDGITNEEALRSDAYDLLQELIDTDQLSFTFDELDQDAKWKVCTYIEPDHDWWLDVYEFFKEDAKEHGFDIDDITFDLGQSGSAAWCGSVDLPRFLAQYMTDPADIFKLEVLTAFIGDAVLDECTNVTMSSWRRSAGMSVASFNLQNEADHGLAITTACTLQGADVHELFKAVGGYTFFDRINKWVEEKAIAYADEIYEALDAQYEYMASEEYAREAAEANGWVFNAKGEIIDPPVPRPAENTSAPLFTTQGE